MSFSVSLSGHVPDSSETTQDDISEAFSNFVRALRILEVDPSGQISGYEGGNQFSLSAADVEDIDEAALLDNASDGDQEVGNAPQG